MSLVSASPLAPEPVPPITSWRQDRVFKIILVVAVLLALAYNAAVLVGFGPDEPRHMAYVKLLLDKHQLPVIESTNPYRETDGAHAFHPPLYYVMLLPFYALLRGLPGESAWHIVRLISGLLCLVALPLTYDVALRGADGDARVARLAAGTLALLPIWGMTAGIINNDGAALFFTALFLWLLTVRFAAGLNLRAALLLGLVLGLGGLCKATVLLCGGVALLVAVAVRGKYRGQGAWLGTGVTLALGALLVSPWHLRSFRLYGTWTPLPQAAPWFNPPLHGLELLAHPDFPRLFALCNWSLFDTLWSQRDWLLQHRTLPIGSFETPQLVIYLVLAALCLLAVAGHLKAVGKRPQIAKDVASKDVDSEEPTLSEEPPLSAAATSAEPLSDTPQALAWAKSARWASYAAFGMTWLTVLQVALSLHQGWAEGGRYLLPAMGGWCLFLARGWAKLFGARLAPFAHAWLGGLLLLNGIALYWLLAYLNPTYGS